MPLHALIVEDSLDDAELLAIELEKSGYNPIYKQVDTPLQNLQALNFIHEDNPKSNIPNPKSDELNLDVLNPADAQQWFLTHVERLEVAIQCLSSGEFDVVLLDLSLPDSSGLDTVSKLHTCVPDIPVVVLTGVDDRELALQAVAIGAQDYLIKNQISAPLLERSIRYAIERKKAEMQLVKSLERERELNQLKLIHTEKMARLGQLVASVAHEINNPVNFIYANLTYVDTYAQDLLSLIDLYEQSHIPTAPEIQDKIEEIDLEFLKEDLPKIVSSIKMGTERICELVLTLRNFSRLEEAQMKAANIHEGIDSTLLMLRDRLKEKSGHPAIEIVKEYENLPLVECYAGQLNQVFMNILSNAIDALHQQDSDNSPNPTITIGTQVLDGDRVRISIKDNGAGMTEAIQARLFDPFFTTKEVGKGTGLGLSISHEIVTKKHGGQLRCISAPGEGAEFFIELPIRQSERSHLPVSPVDASLANR